MIFLFLIVSRGKDIPRGSRAGHHRYVWVFVDFTSPFHSYMTPIEGIQINKEKSPRLIKVKGTDAPSFPPPHP